MRLQFHHPPRENVQQDTAWSASICNDYTPFYCRRLKALCCMRLHAPREHRIVKERCRSNRAGIDPPTAQRRSLLHLHVAIPTSVIFPRLLLTARTASLQNSFFLFEVFPFIALFIE